MIELSEDGFGTGVAVDVKSDPEVMQLVAFDPDVTDVNSLQFEIVSTEWRDIQPDSFSFQSISDPFKVGLTSGVVERQIEFPSSVSGYIHLNISLNDGKHDQHTVYSSLIVRKLFS